MPQPTLVFVELECGAEALFCNGQLIADCDALSPAVGELALMAERLAESLEVPLLRPHAATPAHGVRDWGLIYAQVELPLSNPSLAVAQPLPATLTLDSGAVVDFDARPWFRQAAPADIEAFCAADGRGLAARALVTTLATGNCALQGLLLQAEQHSTDPWGDGTLSVSLAPGAVLAWLYANRTSLWAILRCSQANVRLVDLKGSWGWQEAHGPVRDGHSDSRAQAALLAVHSLRLTPADRPAYQEKQYVLTVAMDTERQNVVLLKKLRGPQALRGKLNFPGGAIEPGETPAQAAVRELAEETGLQVGASHVHWVALRDEMGQAVLHVVAVTLPSVSAAIGLTDEPVCVAPIADVLDGKPRAGVPVGADVPELLRHVLAIMAPAASVPA